MSEKTRSIKTKDVTDVEARDYLLQVSALLNEINRLEEEKDDFNKQQNKEIKGEEKKLESLRAILNDGVVITVHNFMDKDTKQIVWKDDEGNEVERTPFDEQDWQIYEDQYGPKQKPLFEDKKPTEPEYELLALKKGYVIDGECEDIPEGGEYENVPGDKNETEQ
jgi:hypothetical protein